MKLAVMVDTTDMTLFLWLVLNGRKTSTLKRELRVRIR